MSQCIQNGNVKLGQFYFKCRISFYFVLLEEKNRTFFRDALDLRKKFGPF